MTDPRLSGKYSIFFGEMKKRKMTIYWGRDNELNNMPHDRKALPSCLSRFQ